MTGAILILNAGSSSIKFSLYPGRSKPNPKDLLGKGACEDLSGEPRFKVKDAKGATLPAKPLPKGASYEQALSAILDAVKQNFPQAELGAVGHRVVHGGSRYTTPVRIDDEVVAELTKLIPLAPLHQPHHLEAIAALTKLDPKLPQFACFDTAFHATQAPVATAFALPRRFTEEGVRRYGFHGLSYEYIASALPEHLGPEAAEARVVVAHLGAGASMCAMRAGKSVATTMSFTPLDGLPMAQRCGAIDPGVLLYMLQQKHMSADEISDVLYHQSGLKGVSGVSDDMRTLLESDEPHAAEAIDLYVYRIGRELGSLAAALGGLDALVFTAGVGEHAAEIRRRVGLGAAWLGVDIDEAANDEGGPRISRQGSRASAWVIPTDEDLVIARGVFTLMEPRA